MPRVDIKEIRALKLADKEAMSAQAKVAAIHSVASRSQTSPIDLSEPPVNTDFVDIPPSPKPEKLVAP